MTATAPAQEQDWQTANGQPPTRAEFAALIAACEDLVKMTVESGPMNGCLADLGLHRVQ